MVHEPSEAQRQRKQRARFLRLLLHAQQRQPGLDRHRHRRRIDFAHAIHALQRQENLVLPTRPAPESGRRRGRCCRPAARRRRSSARRASGCRRPPASSREKHDAARLSVEQFARLGEIERSVAGVGERSWRRRWRRDARGRIGGKIVWHGWSRFGVHFSVSRGRAANAMDRDQGLTPPIPSLGERYGWVEHFDADGRGLWYRAPVGTNR